ncbi:MAG: sigma-70 family RNA polymerase sigma factor [candidate division WOR-3 bacterium]|nr:sigma-70 family RNA polymerase sigma factor [candidate division WOR-3 bacterium]
MKQLIKPEVLKALPLTDAELVKRAQQGNTSAFEELVRRYERKVYNLVYRMLGNEEDAKDALQDTFIRAYRFIKKFKGKSSFYTWLYRIAANVCFTRLKTRKTKEPEVGVSLDEPIIDESEMPRELPDYKESPEHLFHRQQLQKALQDAINELPSDYRSVVILRDLQGLSNKEVSKALNLSIAAVKSRLHRGRVFLRNRLSKYIAPTRQNLSKSKVTQSFADSDKSI